MVKVFENVFRATNIALVNELLMLCDRMNLNVWEVLEAANTKPFGMMRFMPGPGVGGHCIPLDPHFLEWKAREFNFATRFICLAGDINRQMPGFVREKTIRTLNSRGKQLRGARILALGVAYKKNVGDCRESPAIECMMLLTAGGAQVVYHDPLVPTLHDRGLELESLELTEELIHRADLVLILTDHSSVDYKLVVDHASAILDTRNALQGLAKDRQNVTLL